MSWNVHLFAHGRSQNTATDFKLHGAIENHYKLINWMGIVMDFMPEGSIHTS